MSVRFINTTQYIPNADENPHIMKYEPVRSTNVLASKKKNQNDANVVVIEKQQ